MTTYLYLYDYLDMLLEDIFHQNLYFLPFKKNIESFGDALHHRA
jgi:hypothetical protein